MIEYKDSGEPIPDGRLVVTVSRELANAWDPRSEGFEHLAEDTYTYWFKEIRSHMRLDGCFLINFADDHPERANTRLEIPLVHILAIEVHMNSRMVIDARRTWKALNGS
jgi:hypothetical protein